MTWMNENLYRHLVVLLSALFLLLQLVSIITDETPIEQMRNRLMIKDRGSSASSSSSSFTAHSSQLPHHPTHTRKPKLALLREVFGRGWHTVSRKQRMKTSSNAVLQTFPCQTSLSCPSGSVFCWLLPLHSNPPSVGGISYSALPDYDVWLWSAGEGKKNKEVLRFYVSDNKRLNIFCSSLASNRSPERWRGGKKNSGVNVSIQWTDQWWFFFFPLKSFASDRCCPPLTTCHFSLFRLVWNVRLEFDSWSWWPHLQTSDAAALRPFQSTLSISFYPWNIQYGTNWKSWPSLHKEKLLICTGSSQTALSSHCILNDGRPLMVTSQSFMFCFVFSCFLHCLVLTL